MLLHPLKTSRQLGELLNFCGAEMDLLAGNRCLHGAILPRGLRPGRASVAGMVDPTVDPTVRHLPHTSGELLFRSAAGPEHAGIPIVAPWFAQTLGEQMHGWARALPWRRVSPTECALEHDGLVLTFTASGFDFSLTCRNGGPAPRRIQLALHPYCCLLYTSDAADE